MNKYDQTYAKALEWTRKQKWMFPLGLGMLIAMASALMGMCFASGFDRLAMRGWIYNIGAERHTPFASCNCRRSSCAG